MTDLERAKATIVVLAAELTRAREKLRCTQVVDTGTPFVHYVDSAEDERNVVARWLRAGLPLRVLEVRAREAEPEPDLSALDADLERDARERLAAYARALETERDRLTQAYALAARRRDRLTEAEDDIKTLRAERDEAVRARELERAAHRDTRRELARARDEAERLRQELAALARIHALTNGD